MFKKIVNYTKDASGVVQYPIASQAILSVEFGKADGIAVLTLRDDTTEFLDYTDARSAMLEAALVVRLELTMPARARVGEQVPLAGALKMLDGSPAPINDFFIVPVHSDSPVQLYYVEVRNGELVTLDSAGDIAATGADITFPNAGYYSVTEEGINSKLAAQGLYVLFDGVTITVSR